MAKINSQTWLRLILVHMGYYSQRFQGLRCICAPLRRYGTRIRRRYHRSRIRRRRQSQPALWRGRVRLVRARLREENLPRLSVAVGIGGDIVWAEGFGFADLKTSAPVTPNHRFKIGTASTVLTSAAAGMLLEDGRLKLDDAIQTYVPAFPQKQWPVTLRELMGHTAGVVPDGGALFTKHCQRPVEALPHFAERSLQHALLSRIRAAMVE